MNSLVRLLATVGLPRESAQRLLHRVPRDSINALLDRAVGWSQEALHAGDLRPRRIPATVQFKSAPTLIEETPLVHLSWAAARSGRQAADVEQYGGLPEAASAVRAEVIGIYGDITLESLLGWSWSRGIPVLPMIGKGGYSAAVWAHPEGPVVVLKESRDLAVLWLFDLAHELGHIARGHVNGRSIVDFASPTSPQVFGSEDRQEREASDFALELLVPNHEMLLAEVRRRAAGNYLAFKGAVETTAKRHAMSPGLLGMIAAYSMGDLGEDKDRWGSATNLAKLEGEGRSVVVEIARLRLRLERLDELDQALLETIVLAI